MVKARDDLFACVNSTCPTGSCTVLTGHSQGGAQATVLSILTYSLNPIVITFGQPPAAEENCPFIPSDNFFRFVNVKPESCLGEFCFYWDERGAVPSTRSLTRIVACSPLLFSVC